MDYLRNLTLVEELKFKPVGSWIIKWKKNNLILVTFGNEMYRKWFKPKANPYSAFFIVVSLVSIAWGRLFETFLLLYWKVSYSLDSESLELELLDDWLGTDETLLLSILLIFSVWNIFSSFVVLDIFCFSVFRTK